METTTAPAISPDDPTSFANTHHVQTTHIHLDLLADFDSKTLSGTATLSLAINPHATHVVLDSSNLSIKAIHLLNSGSGPTVLSYTIAPKHPKFGSAIMIEFPATFVSGLSNTQNTPPKIQIQYSTTTHCTGGQWLSAQQTVGRVHPYFFTQCQAIHARSLFPIQDTPYLKITYTASITVPHPLRALMSALRKDDHPSATHQGMHVYHFNQPTPIPSYLIAIAIGNLEGISVGPRTTVWSEPEVVPLAAKEFDDTEQLIQLGERLVLPYDWGIFDLLVLPSSFPYGGMENACLTFVTPTLLAGDKSLVDVITHEFAHSYAGNLVTTKNWEHFWLNEGWCVFLERKLIAATHGEEHRQLHARIGEKALKESVDLFGPTHPFTRLCLDLEGQDPDDSFSSVPYEKGFSFLYYLEQLLGEPTFAAFTKCYFQTFAGKSIDTDDFKSCLLNFIDHYFDKEKLDEFTKAVDWDAWLHAPGMPPVDNQYRDELARPCLDLVARWSSGRHLSPENLKEAFTHGDMHEFHALQKVLFLEQIDLFSTSLPHTHLAHMHMAYGIHATRNCEIRFRWLAIALRAHYVPMYSEACQFLSEVGRMKYVRPLFRLLNQADNGGRDLALKTFDQLKAGYHPICVQQVKKDLGL